MGAHLVPKTFSFADDMLEELASQAVKEDRSQSAIVRIAVRSYLNNANRPSSATGNGADHDRS